MPRCTRCEKNKKVSSFTNSTKTPSGVYPWCRSCSTTYQRSVYRTLDGQLAHRVRTARKNAKRFGWSFDLDLPFLRGLWDLQEGRCAVSGIPFVLDDEHEEGKQPFRPSLDRIQPEAGYVKGNVRLVATIVNFGINKWGFDTYRIVCEAVARKMS